MNNKNIVTEYEYKKREFCYRQSIRKDPTILLDRIQRLEKIVQQLANKNRPIK